jgi:hypothetical protein
MTPTAVAEKWKTVKHIIESYSTIHFVNRKKTRKERKV